MPKITRFLIQPETIFTEKIYICIYKIYTMNKVRKLIDIDEKILNVLEIEAKKQNRSLKSFLEYTLEETAHRLESPSEEYRNMMDSMLHKLEKGKLQTDPIELIEKKYGL